MDIHSPKDDSDCALCLAVQQIERPPSMVKIDDIIYQDEKITAFISSFFIKDNPGHIVIIPNPHFENLYDLEAEYGLAILEFSKKAALALKKALKAAGTTVHQHNEPAGSQHVFHYHMHVFPRFNDDNFYSNITKKRVSEDKEKRELAEKIKKYL